MPVPSANSVPFVVVEAVGVGFADGQQAQLVPFTGRLVVTALLQDEQRPCE